MKVIIVDDEIKRLKKLREGSSGNAKTFYSKLLMYLIGNAKELDKDTVDRINKEYKKRGKKL